MQIIDEQYKEKVLKMIEWTKYKFRLHIRQKTLYFDEREIWWASVGINIGCEIDGKNDQFERPVLIYKKISPSAFWAIPLSTKDKKSNYYIKIKDNDKENRILIVSQLRLLSINRLQRKLGKISTDDYDQIVENIDSLVIKKRNPLSKKVNGNLGAFTRKAKSIIVLYTTSTNLSNTNLANIKHL